MALSPYQVVGDFLTDYQVLERVNAYGRVTVEWYTLVSNDRAVASLRPHSVQVARVPDVTPHQLRPQQRKRQVPRHPPAPRIRAGADAGEPAPLVDEASQSSRASSDSEEKSDTKDTLDPDSMDSEPEADDVAVEAPGADIAERKEEASASSAAPQEMDAEGVSPRGAPAPAPVAEVPPPPAAVGRRRVVDERSSATVVMQVPGGSIAFYPSKMAFQAVCDHRDHGRCVVTRTCRGHGKTPAGHPKGGRPVGFLAAWLGAGEQLPTKADHWAPAVFRQDAETRSRVRQQIAASGESGRVLLSCERPLAEGEPDEPAGLEAYFA